MALRPSPGHVRSATGGRLIVVLGTLSLLATSCNEVLGLRPGELKGPSSGGSAGSSSCSSADDCSTPGSGRAFLCIDGECVATENDDCRILSAPGRSSSKNPIYFGAYSNVPSSSISPFFLNVTLVIDELAANGELVVAGVPRPILVLECTNPEGGREVMERQLDYLIETVHVPGIFMLSDSQSANVAAKRAIGRDQNVLFFHHGAPASAFDPKAHDGRVWHMLPSNEAATVVQRSLVERVERHVNPGRPKPTRVAVTAEAADANTSLLRMVSVNGAPLLDQLDGNVFVIGAQEDASAAIAELEPDIVLETPYGSLVSRIDAAALAAGKTLPFHVLIGDISTFPFQELDQALFSDPTLRTRVVGTRSWDRDAAGVRASYWERLTYMPGRPPYGGAEFSERLYDLAYLMFYAAAGAPYDEAPLNGNRLRDGMRRLLIGDRFEVGPGDVTKILQLLNVFPDASFQLFGTLGKPDFDPTTGLRTRMESVWCIDENLSLVDGALEFDPSTSSLSGDFPCFDF